MKLCKCCNINKEESEFYKGNAKCKSCKIEYQKKYSTENSENIKKYKKRYRSENSEDIKNVLSNYYRENSERMKEKSRNNYSNNRDKKIEYQTKYQRDRRINDPIFKLKHSISRMIRSSLKAKSFKKNSRSVHILGCSVEDFKQYIEDRFDESMNWDNYGKIWDIDHIIPLSSAVSEEDVIKLNHYTNLQPLDSYINRNVKRDRMDFK
jgi:hypothetical protein